MSSSARDVESQLLSLPANERARLAAELIASLEPDVDPDAEQAWLAEGERRLAQLKTGDVNGVPADEVFERAESKLK